MASLTADVGDAARAERGGRAALTVSVVMATYNGAEFVAAQLASIAAQTRPPTELVVCDDGSGDATLAIVERFARDVPFEVRIVRNEQRLGFGENFMHGARCSTGDVIAWCDQDDVWLPEKLARCLREFERDADVVFVEHSTQIGVGTTGGKPVVRGPLAKYRSRRSEQRILRRRSTYDPASLPLEVYPWGHSCLVSRRVLEVGDALASIVPHVFAEFSGHDTWTGFVASAVGKAVLLPDVLLQYRQHVGQVVGAAARPALGTRVVRSAGRSGSSVLDDLELRASRALFRASVLGQLGALLEGEAGLARNAGGFRAGIESQVAEGRPAGFDGGAFGRAALWRRHGNVLGRRLELWRQRSPFRAGACLVRSAACGDYGRADRGGLGPKLFLRDLWRVAQVAARRSA